MKRSLLLFLFAGILMVAVFVLVPRLRPVRLTWELSRNAPLGALATIKTARPSTVRLTIEGMDGEDLSASFEQESRHHEIPVLGLYPDHANRVTFTIVETGGNVHERTVEIRTEPLPDHYPQLVVERLVPELIAPGMLFMQLAHYDENGDFSSLPSAIDGFGRVRWFFKGEVGHIMKQLPNGNLLVMGSANGGTPDRLLNEMDMLGNIVATRADVETGIHHDMAFLDDGNYLLLSSAYGSFEDGVVEVDPQTATVVRGWDFRTILDPSRPMQPRNLEARDWLHLNGIAYDASDDSFIVSGRDQSALAKVRRTDGSLVWILGNHDRWSERFRPYLLAPVGDHTQWQWGQHAPMVHPGDPTRILVYDNGNARSYDDPVDPADNYSRAVEFEVDARRMEVRQVWEYGRENGAETFTPFIGDANYLSNGNRLVCFGGITRTLDGAPTELFDFEKMTLRQMKISARIVEVTGDMPAREVLRVTIADPDQTSFHGYRSYQAEKYLLYP